MASKCTALGPGFPGSVSHIKGVERNEMVLGKGPQMHTLSHLKTNHILRTSLNLQRTSTILSSCNIPRLCDFQVSDLWVVSQTGRLTLPYKLARVNSTLF